MEELLQSLDSTAITTQSNDENKLIAYYKNNGRLGGQEERRKEILLAQKCNRQNRADKSRGILDLVETAGVKTVFRDTQKDLYRPSIYVAGFNLVSPSYRNVLMMSEWLVERPLDFNDEWDVVPCPKGIRMLIVATNGSTKCYNKYGSLKFECRTALPGGNPCNPQGRKDKCCVLDCFYHEATNTMHVLDILAWNSQPMTDGEAEFRYYWVCAQMAEIPELKTINKSNKMLFKLLPRIPCSTESLNNFMMKYPQFEESCPILDGLLFYHRRGHYVSGETPLVGWLFPYMVQEVLGADITVHPAYLDEMPKDYTNQADYILKFAEKQSKKSNGRRKPRSRFTSTNSMDTADSANMEQETNVSLNESNGTTVKNMEAEEVSQERSSIVT